MPNFPVRNLGGSGIISDIHPYDLPPNVFSAGVNVRFENGTVSRGPIFRDVFNLTAYDAAFTPAHVFSTPTVAGGSESILTVGADFSKVYSLIGSTVTDVTPTSGLTTGNTGEPFTHAFLGGVVYLNRRNNKPFYKTTGMTAFATLPGWDSTWRTSVLRAYKDFLIALNVTKGAADFPSMVKWSDLTQYGSAPPSWDATLTTNSAGENVLNQMKGGIVDGHVLRDTFLIYGENEVWAMNYIGGGFIFDFRKRFDDVGVINVDCVVEIDGNHIVFTRNDIIQHDGAEKRSIVHGKNKDFIFGGLIKDLAHLCFVLHNPRLNEVHFCYPSNDRLVGFDSPTTGCNRAAVYNYRRDTWTFYDLPNVTSGTDAIVATGITYASVGSSVYETLGGGYADGSSTTERHELFVSAKDTRLGINSNRIVGLDLIGAGRLMKPLVPELIKDAFVERVGIDMDESGAAIASYKSMLRVFPQISITNGSEGPKFQFGANDTSAVEPAWDEPHAFSPADDYQIPVRKAGRYLAHRLRHSGLTDFSYSGFDATLVLRGRR